MTGVENALEDILEIEDASVKQVEYQSNSNENEMEKDRQRANDVRSKAMEKLGETQKRNCDQDGAHSRKRRSNGKDTLAFFREKNEMQQAMQK